MSDSSSNVSHKTGGTGGSVNTLGTSFTGGTNVQLSIVPQYQPENKERWTTLPQLPSYKLQYSVWHELRSACAHGDELLAPRIRRGQDDPEFDMMNEDGTSIHHSKKGSEKTKQRNILEKWETVKFANFPYQDLSHGYQKSNFKRILKQLIRVEELNLTHNNLDDLGSFSFPCCETLNLNNNHLPSFKDLPSTPRIKHLFVEDNDIHDFIGLERYSGTPLEELCLRGNPITYLVNYRQRVFSMVPNLQVLDGIPKLPEDSVFVECDIPEENKSRCVIS
ncbi:hypothetical protein CHS0354_020709 [Potamilus streckersoni]|uniref:Uncharacterized protein n=1 Tax=Potamilus streckersoni TaxID=2493646 RepID=A0AAE0S7K5_9BIVA|nr:hypothetical protein CHS0354_020709 [Potamilus streckersoni]